MKSKLKAAYIANLYLCIDALIIQDLYVLLKFFLLSAAIAFAHSPLEAMTSEGMICDGAPSSTHPTEPVRTEENFPQNKRDSSNGELDQKRQKRENATPTESDDAVDQIGGRNINRLPQPLIDWLAASTLLPSTGLSMEDVESLVNVFPDLKRQTIKNCNWGGPLRSNKKM